MSAAWCVVSLSYQTLYGQIVIRDAKALAFARGVVDESVASEESRVSWFRVVGVEVLRQCGVLS